MKKRIFVIMALVLALLLCACGKTEAVTNVETLIGQLEDVHLEDSEKVAAAREAYDALTEEEAALVENLDTLISAENRLVELMLMGDWAFAPAEYTNIPAMYDVVDMTLEENMTVTGEAFTGTWYVSGTQLRIDNGEVINAYEIIPGEQWMIDMGADQLMVRTQDMNAKLDQMFTFVDLTTENIDIYCELVQITENEVDKFGTPTGEYVTRITFDSNVADGGMLYFGNEDVVVELIIPEHEYTRSKATKNFKYTEKEGTCELCGCIFGDDGYAVEFFDKEGYKLTHKVSTVSINRVKGTLIFVNSAYVQSVFEEDGSRFLLMDNGSLVCTGNWYDQLEF